MHEDHEPATRRSTEWVWVIALVVTCVLVCAYRILFGRNTPQQPGYLAGASLIPGLVLWVIFYFCCLRKRGFWRNGLAFLAIYVSLIAGSHVAATRVQASLMAKGIAESLQQLKSGTSAPVSTRASGQYGELERVVRIFMRDLGSLQQEYRAELKAAGWFEVLDAKRLSADTGLAESRKRIGLARTIVEKCRQRIEQRKRELRLEVDGLKVSEELKKGFLDAFDSSGNSPSGEAHIWELEVQVVDDIEAMIDFLGSFKGWSESEGSLVFETQEQVDRFDELLESIQATTKRQEQLQAQNLRRANERLESLQTDEHK